MTALGRTLDAAGRAHPVVRGVRAWCDYAYAYEQKYGACISQDDLLGPAWAEWGAALRELLAGPCGGADQATLDALIVANLREAGYGGGT
jgi:hypothetical protein